MTRGVRTAAIAAILLLTVAACRNGDARGKNPLPPLSPSTSLSETPTSPSTPPSPSDTKPTGAKAEVVAFVHAYFEATNLASRTGNTAPWRSMITDDCVCVESIKAIEDAYKGGSIRGLNWTVRDVHVQGVSRADAKLSVTFDVSASDVLDQSGDVVEHVRGYSNARDAMTLTRTGSRWMVADVVQVRLGN